MLIHLFRGPGRIFGCTAEADGANLPPDYGPWSSFKSVEMEQGKPLPGVNVDECLADVGTVGFHLTDAHVRITEKAVGSLR
jgi:hypothetical protein